MTNGAQTFTDLLFYAYVVIHQVRKQVHENYQTCPVPLIIIMQINVYRL